MKIKDRLGNEMIFFDGAMGTMLQSYGLKPGEIPETYNILHPEIVIEINKRYIEAGADIITANTFGANEYKLKDTGYSVEDIIEAAIKNAKKVSKDNMVALSIGPLGKLLKPMGELDFDEAYSAFKRQVVAGVEAGADIIIIQTIGDIYEAKAAILAAKENSSLPVICSMTFQDNGRTLSGTDPVTMVNILQGLGIDALGINCSLGPESIIPILKEVLDYSSIPVIVQPNAGLPKIKNNKTYYDLDEKEFVKYVKEMAHMGATILGGCCGTTPEYIRELKNELSDLTPIKRSKRNLTLVSSATRTIDLGDRPVLIGERINPSGKDELKDALRKKDMGYIIKEAQVQKKSRADILDINLGLPEINEEEIMKEVILKLQVAVDTPLQIDSMKPSVIEKAVRLYNGRPIINSVNGIESTMEDIFPIAKKYGALVIGLTLDEKGIPKKAEDRLKIAEKILKKASEFGIPKKNILIDCLVLTASSQQEELAETLNAIKLVKEKLGVKTVLGISNVSYGLPERHILNRTYLTTALAYGLDAAIADPLDEGVLQAIDAFRVIVSKDKDAQNYIKQYRKVNSSNAKNISNDHRDLKNIIIDGIEEESIKETKKLLLDKSPSEIIDKYLVSALDIVGDMYEREEIFLPQLMKSADTVKASFDIIKKFIKDNGQEQISKGKIVIATVKGDIHDIGKNISKLLLENYGFEIIDLGKDISPEEIVSTVKKEKIQLVGLSALMTTTLGSMEATIRMLRKESMNCKVMVGGAVLNEEYSDMIGADYYAKDARDAIRIAREVFNR